MEIDLGVGDLRRSAHWLGFLKRAMDIVGALIGLILFSPFYLWIAILVKLRSPGLVLFRQMRIGQGGQAFPMLKFRSMNPDSGELLAETLRGDPALRISFEQYQKIWDDPRLTNVGRFLRRTSLDELPQLWNVLKGEMSLVGPRPILPEQRDLYGIGFNDYLRWKPGITGLWQVSGRNHLSFAERVHLDQVYFRRWSIWLDVWILWRTVWVVLHRDGAY